MKRTRDREDIGFMREALRLARRAAGRTSPNPIVGAVLVRGGVVIGRGWHRGVGLPHAEVEAVEDARRNGHSTRGATLYVTLEPCSTHGRTPPCTDAIQAAGLRRVVVGATDPNPLHAGRAYRRLRRAGLRVQTGLLERECAALNEPFNHWIVHRTPLVTVKAAMTLDGKIATRHGESKWITGEKARAWAMRMRRSSDAILVGINTVLADNPGLTVRLPGAKRTKPAGHRLRRIILDSMARTPLTCRLVSDAHAALTTVVVSARAPRRRVAALQARVRVLVAPPQAVAIGDETGKHRKPKVDLVWMLTRLGAEGVTSLLVEGGGEVNGSFLLNGLAQRVAFFYAPTILGGRDSRKAVAGRGVERLEEAIQLHEVRWRSLEPDLLMTARVGVR